MLSTIKKWQVEDPEFWRGEGSTVAYRNLAVSIPALLLAFAIWMSWSAVVTKLNSVGFGFSSNQLFWLISLPGLSGATFRMFFSFVVPVFGGANWTVFSTALLIVPAVGMGIVVQDPQTPYSMFVILALLCGLGGGNFASSMSNISFFFPKRLKGTALGLNAGIGNLGVSAVQFAIPVVIGFNLFGLAGAPQTVLIKNVEKTIWLQNAGFMWVPLLLLSVLAAAFTMNNLASARASFREQSVIFRRGHTWLQCLLYTGTFGSFIGYAAAFPMLIKTQFPEMNPLSFAFLGPLCGALARPVGGWMSDKLSGSSVTFWNFAAMIPAVFGVVYFLSISTQPGAFSGFLAMFLILFVLTGIGNASVFRMIPTIFLTLRMRSNSADNEKANAEGARESAAVLGFSSAVAAFGAFIIPQLYNISIQKTGGPQTALFIFMGFYVVCMVVTWVWYYRRNAPVPC